MINSKVVGVKKWKYKNASLALKWTAALALFMSFPSDSQKQELYLEMQPRQTQTFLTGARAGLL